MAKYFPELEKKSSNLLHIFISKQNSNKSNQHPGTGKIAEEQ
jgi:hypothetical protein